MRAINRKHLKIFTVNIADPTWDVGGFAIPRINDRIPKYSKARLRLREITGVHREKARNRNHFFARA